MATQQTTLTPKIVRAAINTTKQFIADFNKFLETKGVPPIKMGALLGSTAYLEVDPEDKEYGDIDLQILIPKQEGKTGPQVAKIYNDLVDEFNKTYRPDYIHDPDLPANGHIIVRISNDAFVQVDLIWTQEDVGDWVQWRMTPEHNVKGLITGNMFSTLGEIMGIAIQHLGVQVKMKGGKPINYQRGRKQDSIETISTDPTTFGYDILKNFYENIYGTTKGMKVDPMLKQHPGITRGNIKVSDLAYMIQGLARSFELNDMYGKYILKDFANADQFIKAFLDRYFLKAERQKTAKKFDKAQSPEALAKVEHTRELIDKGVEIVKKAFGIG